MSHWDRKALLLLVDDAGKSLDDPSLSASQRSNLQGLLAHYGNKAKSIHTSPMDVLAMQSQLRQILNAGPGES